jgi:hypothetical protein
MSAALPPAHGWMAGLCEQFVQSTGEYREGTSFSVVPQQILDEHHHAERQGIQNADRAGQ